MNMQESTANGTMACLLQTLGALVQGGNMSRIQLKRNDGTITILRTMHVGK